LGGADAPAKLKVGRRSVPEDLARLRRLRGTAFDVFGYTAERRMERALIAEFEQLLEERLPALAKHNLEQTTALASAYMEIRGYGPVKEAAAATVRDRIAREHDTRPDTRSAA
jgi:indolepyruvate ferredoxin oxidoreductase